MSLEEKKMSEEIKLIKKKLSNESILKKSEEHQNEIQSISSQLHKNKNEINMLNFEKTNLLLET